MDRYWFFTWRTYGTWLPGEDGFVGYYRDVSGERWIDNVPGRPLTGAIPPLERYSRNAMTGEPVYLTRPQAEALLAQLHETAAHCAWEIDVVAVLSNHVHLVFGVPGDPDPSRLLKRWKEYASRALNRVGPKPNAPRWFADGGSKRPLPRESHWVAAVRYVRDQEEPLAGWMSDKAKQFANGDEPVDGVGGEPAT